MTRAIKRQCQTARDAVAGDLPNADHTGLVLPHRLRRAWHRADGQVKTSRRVHLLRDANHQLARLHAKAVIAVGGDILERALFRAEAVGAGGGVAIRRHGQPVGNAACLIGDVLAVYLHLHAGENLAGGWDVGRLGVFLPEVGACLV